MTPAASGTDAAGVVLFMGVIIYYTMAVSRR